MYKYSCSFDTIREAVEFANAKKLNIISIIPTYYSVDVKNRISRDFTIVYKEEIKDKESETNNKKNLIQIKAKEKYYEQ